MAEESDLDRTEAPTGRRIEQAREQGQVPHSRELGTFLTLMVSAAALWMARGWFSRRAMEVTRKGFVFDSGNLSDPRGMLIRFGEIGGDAAVLVAPLLALLVLASLLPPFFLNAWVFAPKALAPDFARLNPLTGFGRMFSWSSLAELGKAMLKAILVGGVGVLVVWNLHGEIIALLAEPLESGVMHAGRLISLAFLLLAGVLVLVVAADVPFQLWQYFDRLKMTRDEVRQEMKEMLGDPQVKGRIRSLQLQAARRRMMAAVPKADVVVTNPTHFAVALAYKQGMAAPKVVAKGTGEIARRIREIAAFHAVPLLEAPPLARALHKHVELDAEIPANLYAAVAEVLAYVFQLSQWRARGGQYPLPPRDLPVPADLVPEPS